MVNEEIWKDIKGYGGLYQVSSFGRVKSLARIKSKNGFYKEKFMRPNNNGNGYLQIGLSKNNKVIYYYIHRLVAQAFLLNINNYKYINHKDGNKTNNKVNNLEWCTQSENVKHAYRIKLMDKKGEKHHLSKLTKNDIFFIRKNSKNYLQKELAEMFKISQQQVSRIINKIEWSHV